MEYIVDFKPFISKDNNDLSNIEERISKNQSITENEADEYLRDLIYRVRKIINPNMDNFDMKCNLAQSILGHYFDEINCKYAPCATHHEITTQIDGHSFVVVTLNVEGQTKNYLVDPTYIQFFHQDKCNSSAYFISPMYPDKVLLTPDAGFFIQQEDKEPVDFLLRYGYIELTDEYARIYGDSFLNTKTGTDPQRLTYQSMPGGIYINSFLKGNEVLVPTKDELKKDNKLLQTYRNKKQEFAR